MFTISKQFEFSAAHVLSGLPAEHQCGRMHGHNYTVEVELQSEGLDTRGFVQDFGELIYIKGWLDDIFDHRTINDVVSFNPTAENLAFYIYEKMQVVFPLISAVTVCETPKTKATYRESDSI
jgi:6-pyruvoyltetrahydropterin/6-carboxytetrahydropterin synthase